jgi:hypothetical protein
MRRKRFKEMRKQRAEGTGKDPEAPRFISVSMMALAAPQSYWLYKLIWADPCSDAFFSLFEMTFTWIALNNALDASAACALGFIDYRTRHERVEDIRYDMRKKRLAFAKFCFIMTVVALCMIDKPSKNAVLPMLIGQGYVLMKYGYAMAYNLTPENFFIPRNFLQFYNIIFLLLLWYKLRQAR